MALIQCPHCGKSVSDTAEKCIHCGENLRQSVEEKPANSQKDYVSLNFTERKALKDEFYKLNPKYPDFEYTGLSSKKKQRICYILGIVFYAIAVAIAYFTNFEEPWQAVAVIVLFVAGLICDTFWYVFLFGYGKEKKKSLREAKKYQKWLKEVKNINYEITFSSKEKKWKRYFDGINADVEEV